MSPSATIIAISAQLVTQAGSPDRSNNPENQVAPPPADLCFPIDAAEKLARTPVVHDLLSRTFMVPGAATLEDRRRDSARATDFVTACIRDRRRFSSPEQAAHALLLIPHRSVAASLALAHAVVDLLEPAANNR